ncbi:PhoPQ-activated pathogenicity-related family protein [Arthrospiribacter ruber]|uniref:PhoPQ-activated pathogenicity-like protein PqaA type n=1 Tax=Arthrospiribacter ruber TaxID=2487934 RepID=A0A951IVN2_9BACT|nr:PhoPQ-activated protein PqaA family protein [Arthrospiribacter ruber]MBW3466729.1 PhoPQ-activated pathogenicity-like protein PqaA type [Arthrospiribacter ruber]
MIKRFKDYQAFGYLLLLTLLWSCGPQVEIEVEDNIEASTHPLWEYVLADDPDFSYELVHTSDEGEYDFAVVKMVSQNWLSPDIVDKTEWWHWVSMVIPKDTPHTTGMMWIGGGSQNTKMPEKPDQLILEAAMKTNSVVATVHNVPFQPLVFANDTFGERYEDAIIAYGWRKFLEGGAKDEDAIWLARLPMTRAVKLAMDVVTGVASSEYDKDVENYMVAGASKRGWTTWTIAAVDDRVVAMAPVVIDLLNVEESFKHHWKNYGYWAPAVGDYVREEIMEWQGSEEYKRLNEIVEPYSFLEEYKDIPKLIINAAGDEFFQPDSWKFYWDDLKGEKHIQYVPNHGHDLSKSDALPNLISFYASILHETPRPKYDWKIEGDKIIVNTDPNQKPASIKLWQATNPNERNFMIDRFGPKWTSSEIILNESGKYEVEMIAPENGYTAFFVEITYPGEAPVKVTTGVDVLPRSYPFEDYVSESPRGSR